MPKLEFNLQVLVFLFTIRFLPTKLFTVFYVSNYLMSNVNFEYL